MTTSGVLLSPWLAGRTPSPWSAQALGSAPPRQMAPRLPHSPLLYSRPSAWPGPFSLSSSWELVQTPKSREGLAGAKFSAKVPSGPCYRQAALQVRPFNGPGAPQVEALSCPSAQSPFPCPTAPSQGEGGLVPERCADHMIRTPSEDSEQPSRDN